MGRTIPIFSKARVSALLCSAAIVTVATVTPTTAQDRQMTPGAQERPATSQSPGGERPEAKPERSQPAQERSQAPAPSNDGRTAPAASAPDAGRDRAAQDRDKPRDAQSPAPKDQQRQQSQSRDDDDRQRSQSRDRDQRQQSRDDDRGRDAKGERNRQNAQDRENDRGRDAKGDRDRRDAQDRPDRRDRDDARENRRQDAGRDDDRRERRQDARDDRRDRGDRVTERERTRISTSIQQANVRPLRNVNFSVSVGTVIPASVEFYPVTSAIVEVYPQYRGYSFVVVEDDIVIVEPRSKKIVQVIDFGRGSGRAESRGRLKLSDQQRDVIRRTVIERRTTGSAPATIEREIVIGDDLPEAIEIEAFPDTIYTEVPEIRSYRYVVRDRDVYVIDPSGRRVIDIIE